MYQFLLSNDDVRKLAAWLQSYFDDVWDRQIEEDLQLGKLDQLISRAEADIAAGNVRELDESFTEFEMNYPAASGRGIPALRKALA
ncbi:MAG: hypothetical protein AAGE92_10755, partial [Cyanobacteria bacterium P01_G01_bin.4]